MDNWEEMRTAYRVAKLGTVSAAAEDLGVHRATVIRHIDRLEATLGSKLFQRHARGYAMTEVGEDLLRIAETTDQQFNQLAARAKGKSETLGGTLTITAVDVIATDILPAINAFSTAYPDMRVRFRSSEALMKLEYGEADVAFRVGPKPEDPDNVVMPFKLVQMALYATTDYVQQLGMPRGPEDFSKHRFVGPDSAAPRASFMAWMAQNVPAECIRFTSGRMTVQERAVQTGTGIGFLPVRVAEMNPDLVEVLPPRPDWEVPIWTVTHVDLHRSAKVQAFLRVLKEMA